MNFRFQEAALSYIRMTNENKDLRSGLLLEQAAYCYLLCSQPYVRKCAFYVILAGFRFSKSGQKHHSSRVYGQGYQVLAFLKHVTLPISNLDIVWNKFSYLSDLQGPWLVVIGRPHPVLAWPPVSPPERFQDCSQHFQRVAVHGHPSPQPNSTNVPPQGILHCPPWQREEGKEDSRNSHSKLRPAKLHSGVVGRRRW